MNFPEVKQFSLKLGDQEIIAEIGRIANQADGACTLRSGDTVVLGTAVMSKNPPREGVDFLPLMVNFQEKLFAAGMIKSSRFIKRETRPSDDKILISRLVDRSLRPLFPKYLRSDVQVMLYPLSYDKENQHDMLAACAGSLAVTISQIPFDGPCASVRVGLINDQFVLNPTTEQKEASDLDLIVSSTKDNVVMIEAGANEVSEEKMLSAIAFGKEACQKICNFFLEIQQAIGKPKIELTAPAEDAELEAFVQENFTEEIRKCIFEYEGKLERFARKKELADLAKEKALEKFGEERDLKLLSGIFDGIFKNIIRESVLKDEKRILGRKLTQIRPLKVETTVLPRTHGSAIFTRGETQALTVVTLGGPGDALITEGIEGEKKTRFFHFYNFPPYSVGECSNRLFTGNREVGHGALAQRALLSVMPATKDFAYTIHANTEIMSSNGSSSMAATCGTTLALMDAGVPIKAPVAGIAMGLMSDENGNFKILSDIQDEEDFGGDMDFKVAGTAKGITAIQMDIKVKGLTPEIFEKALAQAKDGRMEILNTMLSALPATRKDLSKYAPRLITIQINPEKIRLVIGKGGETINKIVDQTGAQIDIEQDGTVVITSVDAAGGERAAQWVRDLTFEPTVGEIYDATVVRIEDYGAFAEIKGGAQGLIHISLISKDRIDRVSDVLKLGQVVKIKLLDIDAQGRLRFSMKDAA